MARKGRLFRQLMIRHNRVARRNHNGYIRINLWMMNVKNAATRRTAMQIHIQYNIYIQEYDTDGIEREFYKYLDNERNEIPNYTTETITKSLKINTWMLDLEILRHIVQEWKFTLRCHSLSGKGHVRYLAVRQQRCYNTSLDVLYMS